MNCIKCNNQIPDGAKFCPICGASYLEASDVAPTSVPDAEPEKRYFCEKCGLELSRGVKFCAVCGGAAYAKDVSPLLDTGDTFGEGTMSAISLDKPSQSDDLVSAMNTAAAASESVASAGDFSTAAPASESVPMPTDSFPAPSGVPMPSESGFNSGFSAPAPSFASPADAADAMGGFAAPAVANVPNYGNATAAVKPIKKKNKVKIALIITAAVVVIALGIFGIIFATNPSAVLAPVMGKSKYAAMVEGNDIKKMTQKIDIPAVADGIKATSSVIPLLMSYSNSVYIPRIPTYGMGMTDKISGSDVKVAPMMSYGYNGSGMSNSGAEFDLTAVESLYAELLQSAFGKSNISGSIKANVEIGKTLKSMLSSSDADTLDEVLDYVNKTSITYSVTANEDAAAFTYGTEGKFKINAKVLMYDQEMYISLPFVSDKAIMFTLDKPATTNDTAMIDIKPLELDEKELERIIGEIIQIYLDHYKELEIEMDKGEIEAADVTVSGKLITAEFSMEDIVSLLEDICEFVANDDYLTEQLVDYINSFGVDIDEDDYTDSIMSMFDNIDIDEDSRDRFTIETVINNKGDVLGKTYEVVFDNEKVSLSYADTKKQSGVEFKAGANKIIVLNEKTNNTSGTYTVKCNMEGESLSCEIEYSDVKEIQFCGNKTLTGNFELGVKLPKEFSDQLGEEGFAAINGAKLSLKLSSDSPNTFESTVGLKVPSYFDVSLTETLTVSDDTSELEVPSDVIDATPLTKGEYLDDESAEAMVELLKDAAYELVDIGTDLGADMDSFIDDIEDLDTNALTGKVAKNDIDNLLNKIDRMINTIDSDIEYYEYYDYDTYVRELKSLKSGLNALAEKIRNKNYKIKRNEFEEFKMEYDNLYSQLYW